MRKQRVKLRSFGEKIKELRKHQHLTQRTFADKMGISLDTVKNWEQGYNYPSVDLIVEIADYFKCDFDYLLGEQSTPNKIYKHFSEETQLSLNAVEALMLQDQNGNYYGELVSALLENEELLSQLLLCCQMDYSQVPNYDHHIFLAGKENIHSFCRPDYVKRSNEMRLYDCMCKFIAQQRKKNGLQT